MYELRMANGEIRKFPDEARVYFGKETGKLTIRVDEQKRVFSDAAWTELIYPEQQQEGGAFSF